MELDLIEVDLLEIGFDDLKFFISKSWIWPKYINFGGRY